MRLFILAILGVLALSAPASAQAPGSVGDVERAFGMGWDSFDKPIEASTRDANGNRTIINGQIQIEGTLTGGLMDGSHATGLGSSQAIGNQLNVVTQGNWNTVIVDAAQINNGDISAVTEGAK